MLYINFLNIIEFIIILLLILLIIFEMKRNKSLFKQCNNVIDNIVSDNLTLNLTKQPKLNKLFSKITKKLLKWIYRTLKCSTEISEQLNTVYRGCNNSMNKCEKIKKKYYEFNEKSSKALSYLNEQNNISKEMYIIQEKIAALSESASITANNAGEYINSGSNLVENTLAILEDMNDGIENSVDRAGKLLEVIGKVSDMTKIINSLSESINLLSLNASIEAARAGEAGKGFEVVASEIKGLADKTSIYAGSITENIVETNQTINEVIGVVRALSGKRSDVKKSADSIKDYFNNINMEMGKIINSVDKVSLDITQGLSLSEDMKKTSENIEEFFYKFNKDIEIINKDVENQYEIEAMNSNICNKVRSTIKSMLEFTQEFENIISQRLIEYCSDICEKLTNQNMDNDLINKYCAENGISEIYITDYDGVTVLSNNKSAIGFRFSEDEKSQAQVFRKILEDEDCVINQNFKKRDLDDKYYKFVAIARKDKKGIIQAGLDLEDILQLKI